MKRSEGGSRHDDPVRIAYLFTTFPVLTETPSQRELRVLRDLPVTVSLYSLWGGEPAFEGQPVHRFPKWQLVTLLWLLPYWLARRPGVFVRLTGRLLRVRARSLQNVGETLIGLGFGLCYAHHFARAEHRPDLLHAVWATMPATAAQLLSELTGLPYSLGAHAYDVFAGGGDWLLPSKLRGAALVVTSSEATRRRLLERGAPEARTVLVRRGLERLPAARTPRPHRNRLRILSVGRLVAKKGYAEQLALYAALEAAGLAFEARIVGGGPLKTDLRRRVASLGLSERVFLLGPLPHEAVREQYRWADVLIFTGRVAPNGDRDGLPNVIPEAMALGVPVVSTPVAGVPEAIRDGETGVLVDDMDVQAWLAALSRLQRDDGLYDDLRLAARAWVETNYDARRNTEILYGHFRRVFDGRAAESGVDATGI